MKFYKILAFTILSTSILSCGDSSKKKKNYFSVEIANKQGKFKLGETLTIGISNPQNQTIDSVTYTLQGKKTVASSGNFSFAEKMDDEKLGYHTVQVSVFANGTTEHFSKKITILNDKAPKIYNYKILASHPHDQKAFTQGLEFHGDTLYESTGQNGFSSLRKTDYTSGKVLVKKDLDQRYFAEGITILNNKIMQLTWLAKEGFIYDLASMDKVGSFAYGNSQQGWGLCNDGSTIYKSDGSERIWLLDAETLAEKEYIQITTNKSVKSHFNELEWVDGKIYANTWPKNGATDKRKLKGSISIINPKNGALEAVIDLRDLRTKVTQHEQLDVLNGIAYKADTKQLFVTGKNWDTLFEIEIIKP